MEVMWLFRSLPIHLPFHFPNTCVGSNPSQFQGVGGSEMIEGIEAFNDCSAFDVECYWGEHFLKLFLNCCITGPEMLCASLIYTSAQQFRT